jgi:phage recombination protein Bet
MSQTAIIKPAPASGVQPKPSALQAMAARLSVEPAKLLNTLKSTVFQKASDEEVMALTVVANEYDLNPFLKEIYAFPAKGGGIVPIVSVDGWNKMLIRQPDFDGIEFEFNEDSEGKLVSCTAIIHVKSRSHPVKITEYLNECKRNTEPWNSMPRRMLRNRTLCQASRVAFGFSGVSNADEAQDIIEVTSTVTPTEPPPKMIAPSDAKPSVQSELSAVILGAGFSFAQFIGYVGKAELIRDADSLGSFDDINTADATRLLRAKAGLLAELKKFSAPAE